MNALRARRVGLVADSHGRVLPQVLAGLAGVDLIIHAGDVGAARVLRELGAIAPVIAVRGNNDVPSRWSADEQDVCAALAEHVEVALVGGLLVVVHGHRWPAVATRHARLRATWPQARWVVYGHSHRRVVDDRASPWVLNPGACGPARAHGGAGWMELRRDGDSWRAWQPPD